MRLALVLLAVLSIPAACSAPGVAPAPAEAEAPRLPGPRPEAPTASPAPMEARTPLERPDTALQGELEALLAPFRGVAGVYVRHLGDGRSAAIRAEEVFPAASTVKVPILLALFERLERGELDYRERLTYRAERKAPGEDLLARFQDGETIAVSELALLMCSLSDNTASLWCQELAGSGAAVNAWLERRGFAATRVNSHTGGREGEQRRNGWGQTTPRELAELLVAIRERRAVSPAADEEMERLLSRSAWTGEALSAIPPSVHVLSKQGAVSAARSEVLLVDGPSGSWVLCVMTRDQEDRSWRHGNEGFQLLRDVASAVWRRFEPGHPWSPAPGAERYR
jgi:beta-lactamase class A